MDLRCALPILSSPNWATVLTGLPPSDSGVFHQLWHWHMSSKKYDSNNWESYLPPIWTDYQQNIRSVYDVLKDMQKLVNERNQLLDMRKKDY